MLENDDQLLFQLRAIRTIFEYIAEENPPLAGDFSIMFQEIAELIEKIENIKE